MHQLHYVIYKLGNYEKQYGIKNSSCTLRDILFQMFWRIFLKTFYSLKLHIFFILNLFWMIKKAIDTPTNDLQDYFEV
jgi:hypothetical protein